MPVVKTGLLILFGFSSGVVISGAVFALIAAIGIVTRLAQKTKTQGYVKVYEEAIILGGIFGATAEIFKFNLPIGMIGAGIFSLLTGIFVGCLAMSLAEVLDVIPILTRRGRVQEGLFFLILAIALGKMTGSLIYFTVTGFYSNL